MCSLGTKKQVHSLSRPIKYYLEVILYNCVQINNRLSLKPLMPYHESGFEGTL